MDEIHWIIYIADGLHLIFLIVVLILDSIVELQRTNIHFKVFDYFHVWFLPLSSPPTASPASPHYHDCRHHHPHHLYHMYNYCYNYHLMQKGILASLCSIVTSIHVGLLVRDVPGDDFGYIIVNVIDYMYLQFRTELLQS